MHPILRRVLPVSLFFPLVAHGTVVTTTADEDDGSLGGGTGISLREAVKYSPAADTISFDAALSGQTVRLILGEILIAQSLTIDGSTLPTRITLSGDKTGDGGTADDSRILNITTGTVILDSLILTGGICPAVTASPWGAAIYVGSTTTKLTVQNSSFSENLASEGGAIYFYGRANHPDSFLRIENSNFTDNSATGVGGAIFILGRLFVYDSTFTANTARQGGAIFSRGDTGQISNSIFSGNSATSEGGAIWNYRTLKITSTTVFGNSAPYGGGIFSSFGGVLTLENSTLTANFARNSGGGIFVSGAITTLLHSTLTGNTALVGGGGIWRKTSGSVPVGDLSVNRSIATGNTAPAVPDFQVPYTGANNLTSGTPLLAPLGIYGGSTPTMPPVPGSPAIDAGGTTTLAADQRGFPRVSFPDIGAAEYQGTADLTRFWKLDLDADGSPYGVEQALGTDNFTADLANPRNLTAPAIDGSGHAVLSFGITSGAAAGTRWILRRSPDFSAGSFAEIYRFDGLNADSPALGITFVRTATSVTVTDSISASGTGLYRLEAVLEP